MVISGDMMEGTEDEGEEATIAVIEDDETCIFLSIVMLGDNEEINSRTYSRAQKKLHGYRLEELTIQKENKEVYF